MSIFELFAKVKETSKTTEKLKLFETFKKSSKENEQLLFSIFSHCYDRISYIYYIRKIPEYTPISGREINTLEILINKLHSLSDRTYTGNAGIEYFKSILESSTEEQADLLIKIIKRDLDIGSGIGTTEKLFPGVIKKPKLLLVSPCDYKKIASNIKFPAYAQKKEDGSRAIMIKKGDTLDDIEFYTRSGNIYNKLDHIKQEILNKYPNVNIVLDGEMLYKTENNSISSRQVGNGIVNKSIEDTITNEEAIRIYYTIWDAVPLDKYNLGVSNLDYKTRFHNISQMFNDTEHIKLVETFIVNNIEEAEQIYKNYRDQDYEGIILKDYYEIWKDYRSSKMFKFKEEKEIELKCIEVHNHSKKDNLLGSITLESNDSKIIVSCGSGFKYKPTEKLKDGTKIDIPILDRHPLDRELLMYRHLTFNDVIGSIFTIKCNGLSTTLNVRKNGAKYSLYLPVVIIERKDKDIANNLEDVFVEI